MIDLTNDVTDNTALIVVALLSVGFGLGCVFAGHNSTVISSVFFILGIVIDRIYGEVKKSREAKKTK